MCSCVLSRQQRGRRKEGFKVHVTKEMRAEREQSQDEGAMMKNTVEARLEESQIVIKMKFG